MRQKRLDNERAQLADRGADGLVLAQTLGHPLLDLCEVLVDGDQSQLAATLDQLVGLHHQRLHAFTEMDMDRIRNVHHKAAGKRTNTPTCLLYKEPNPTTFQ